MKLKYFIISETKITTIIVSTCKIYILERKMAMTQASKMDNKHIQMYKIIFNDTQTN